MNVSNIKNIVLEIFGENIIRGRALFVRSLLKAQMASPNFTHVYAALVSVVNTKMPEIGELLLKRVLNQFRRAYKRNDKIVLRRSSEVRSIGEEDSPSHRKNMGGPKT